MLWFSQNEEMNSHELCIELEASVEFVCTSTLCVLHFHAIQVVHVAIALAVLSIFAIQGHVFTAQSGVMAWERGQQLAFLVVIRLPTLRAFFRF